MQQIEDLRRFCAGYSIRRDMRASRLKVSAKTSVTARQQKRPQSREAYALTPGSLTSSHQPFESSSSFQKSPESLRMAAGM